jgi:hypothetical protein
MFVVSYAFVYVSVVFYEISITLLCTAVCFFCESSLLNNKDMFNFVKENIK